MHSVDEYPSLAHAKEYARSIEGYCTLYIHTYLWMDYETGRQAESESCCGMAQKAQAIVAAKCLARYRAGLNIIHDRSHALAPSCRN